MKIILVPKSFLRMKIKESELVINVDEGVTALDICVYLADKYGDDIKNYLFCKTTGDCQILFVVNRKQVTKDHVLKENDRITIFSPLAGG